MEYNKPQNIYLPKDFDTWRWFQNHNVVMVYLWLLFNANLSDTYYFKDSIKRGSIVTTNSKIAKCCKLTISNVRTALANLECTGEISRESRNHYQIITVTNFDKYVSE